MNSIILDPLYVDVNKHNRAVPIMLEKTLMIPYRIYVNCPLDK